MIFTKKMNIKLAIIAITFMILLTLTNGILMDYGITKSVEFTYKAHYKKAEENLENDVNLLKEIVEKVAENKKIIRLLEEKKDISDLSEIEANEFFSEMDSFETYLRNLIFIDTVNIASYPGKYLLSKGKTINNFDLKSRPWFKEEYFNMKGQSIVTQIHKDFNTGKYAIAVVKFIYSTNSDELLGAVILDIYIEDFIKFSNSDFYMGDLETYVKVSDNKYICSKGIVKEIENKKNDYIVSLDGILNDDIKIIMQFDKDSIVYSKEMKKVSLLIITIFGIIGTIYVLILTRLIKVTFRPVLKTLERLKSLLEDLEKNNFQLESKDEVKQLEIISNSLTKSFDKKIQSLIYYDDLTNVPNRKLLIKICNDLINSGCKFALVFIDLNKFKYINDLYGHIAGDELLVRFSETMSKCVGNKGIITRYSGDEFIIIYKDYVNNDELEEFYKNIILKEFNKPILINNKKKIYVEFAAGVSVYPKDGKTFEELIDKSDFMMYSSKKSSDKNKLLFFNDSVYNEIIRIELIKEQLKTAVDKKELILYYQPIVNKDKEIKKLEALIRWNNKKLGFVSPIDFIGYAEETGEIIKIGYWIIEEVCKNFVEVFNNGEIDQVSINVSPIQLMEFDFVDKLKEITERYNVDLKNLCFEITESVVLDGNIIVYDNIYLLHRLGVSIALDDFGTGYASFSYLKKFRLNILKIDKIFIDDNQEVDYKIVDNIKNIAHLLNMKIVIEGVETEKQFSLLNEVGCDYFQGYYFSKPVELNQVLKMIKDSHSNKN